LLSIRHELKFESLLSGGGHVKAPHCKTIEISRDFSKYAPYTPRPQRRSFTALLDKYAHGGKN